jgi:hypothetical protein
MLARIIVVVIAIGLMWSVAAMSNLIPITAEPVDSRPASELLAISGSGGETGNRPDSAVRAHHSEVDRASD